MYAIKIIPNKRKMDDWFLYRDPDELVVQCWNEKEDAEIWFYSCLHSCL